MFIFYSWLCELTLYISDSYGSLKKPSRQETEAMIYDHECMCGTWVGDFSPPAMNEFDEIPTKIQFVNNEVESLLPTLHTVQLGNRAGIYNE